MLISLFKKKPIILFWLFKVYLINLTEIIRCLKFISILNVRRSPLTQKWYMYVMNIFYSVFIRDFDLYHSRFLVDFNCYFYKAYIQIDRSYKGWGKGQNLCLLTINDSITTYTPTFVSEFAIHHKRYVENLKIRTPFHQ